MNPKAIKEILNSDPESLLNIIDSYQNYHPITVLLTYAELKKRNFDFGDFPKKVEKLNNFSSENKNSNIDDLLSSVLKQNGYNSYQEALEKKPEMILPSKNRIVKSDPQKTSRIESWYQKPFNQVLIGIVVFIFVIRVLVIAASNSNSNIDACDCAQQLVSENVTKVFGHSVKRNNEFYICKEKYGTFSLANEKCVENRNK